MTTRELSTPLAAFPMGPKLREFLEITSEDYRGEQTAAPDARAIASFQAALTAKMAASPPTHEEQLIDLLDELVAMNVPEAAMQLRSAGDALWTGTHFRGELAVGIAAMLTEQFDQAEQSLRRAQELNPNEPAPYVNMALIAFANGDIDNAREWSEAGLEVEPNNFRMWEVLAQSIIGISGEDHAAAQIREVADHNDSWAGYSLAADLEARGDINLKARYLKPFYDKGLRDGEFLVEYTAALGMAAEYDQIPQIVWDAERSLGLSKLPWELYLHAAQAHLAQNRVAEGLAVLDKAERHPQLSSAARSAVQALREEARSEDANS